MAIPGLWNWTCGSGELIADFNLINFQNRDIYVVPDNDWRSPNINGYKKYLDKAVYKLARLLFVKGSRVHIVELPPGPLKGLDDYLCKHSLDELKDLPKKVFEAHAEVTNDANEEIQKEQTQKTIGIEVDIEKKAQSATLAEKPKGDAKPAQEGIKGSKPSTQSETKKPGGSKEPILIAHFNGLIDIAIGANGKPVFLMKSKGGIIETRTATKGEETYAPPAKDHLPYLLPRSWKVLKYVEDLDEELFDDLLVYLKRFSYLPDGMWVLVAGFIFLSYQQDNDDIQYLPYILFWAEPERGKSRTGKACTYVTYRGVHVVDLREANLFRFSENLEATIFFDLKDIWKKAERSRCEDILLERFEKGAKISRVISPEKGPFKDTFFYSVFGPTIIATNEPVHRILGTRCISIAMPNAPSNKYENPSPGKGLELKERLVAWRARTYKIKLPRIEPIDGITGRLWDVTEPLFKICKLVRPELFGTLKEVILGIADQRTEDKKGSLEGMVVAALDELMPEGLPEYTVRTNEVLKRLNKDMPEGHQLTPQWLGIRLKAMGVRTRTVHGYSETVIERPALNVLLIQHGLKVPSMETGEALPNPTTLKDNVPLDDEKNLDDLKTNPDDP